MFQFHNGTINTIIDVSSDPCDQCFNSTTVQLIQSFANALIAISEFQFHNGTINTVFVTLTISEESVSIPQRYN